MITRWLATRKRWPMVVSLSSIYGLCFLPQLARTGSTCKTTTPIPACAFPSSVPYRGNFACRQVWHHRAHFAANDRAIVSHRHFKLGMVEREFRSQPCSDMFVPEVQRCADEEITFSIPVWFRRRSRPRSSTSPPRPSATLTGHSSTGRSERRT